MPYNEPTYGESGEVYTDNVRNSLAHVKSAAEAAQATADNAVASVVTASQTADEAKEIALAAQGYLETPTDGRMAEHINDATSQTRAALSATYASLDGSGDLSVGGAKLTADNLPYGSPVLARTEYNPGTTATPSTTSTTSVDVDATNLVVTFTAPDDGAVDVTLEALTDVQSAGVQAIWSLRSGGADVPGTITTATRHTNGIRVTARIRVTGLTPGASYTYTWGHKTSADTSYARLILGGNYGPARMTVGKV